MSKLDHSVFDGTRCTRIKETEGLTAGQIKTLNPSICLVSAQRRAGQDRGSDWQRDYREETRGTRGGGAGGGKRDERRRQTEERQRRHLDAFELAVE